MTTKQTFFSSLNSRSAMIVGVIAGFLVLSTIGFIVLTVIMVSGKTEGDSTLSANTTVAVQNTNTASVATMPTKTDKPKVELFIMSYCPYGLQMQKAYLPVMNLLGKKSDMDIKWVNYIMHEKQEIDENNVQYCIQKEQNDKYLTYAQCFTANGGSEACRKTANINENKLKNCISTIDKKFGITDGYNNKSTWLSGYYPLYKVHDELNKKYGIQGSPTLVINGQEIQNVSRTPEAIKQIVCESFTNMPNECNTILSSVASAPGIGTETGSDTVGVDCET